MSDKPYSNLYLNHCNKRMAIMPPSCIDLTVTSPPYDDLRDYEGTKIWDESTWRACLSGLYRVTKKGGVVVWVVGDSTKNGSESGTSFKQALAAIDIGFNLHDTMIYEKDNPPPVGGSGRYYQHFEYMFVFSKGKPKTFNKILTKRRNKHKDTRTSRVKAFNRNSNGNFKKSQYIIAEEVMMGNVWRYVVGGGNSIDYGIGHPATFPSNLVRDHVQTWTNAGDVVFDPLMGSGTTGVVCKRMGRSFVGIEIVNKYYKLSCNRIDSTTGCLIS